MGYYFDNEHSATVKFNRKNNELSLNGINGAETNANVIVNGINLLLSIGGISSRYDALDAIRTVKQDVKYQD